MKKQNEKQMKNQTKKVVSVLCAAALLGSGDSRRVRRKERRK